MGAFEIRRQHRASLASLHFAQNYLSSVSKILQSCYRALKVFYQTSLLSLCNLFCQVYERSLKRLKIDNISRHDMSQNQVTNSFIFIFKWIDIDNVSKQICSVHNWIILFDFMKSKNYAFHISFNKTSWCKI